MGTCQSHSERRRSRHPFDADGGDIPLAKGGSRHNFPSIKSTPGGGRKSSAYDLQLISPSERTAATDALSPTSISSPTFTTISPIKKENFFDFEVKADEDDQSSSYQELDGCHSHLDANSFIDPEFTEIGIETGIGIEKEENFNDQDIPVLSSADLIHSLTKEYDFQERRQDENDDIGFGENLTDKNFATLMAESHREAIVDYSSSKIENGVSNNSFERHDWKADFDSPPLLAPPDDIPIALQHSSTYTAVDPAIYATFNKVQKEVTEREKHDKQRRREEKIKDRRRDIQGYRELWGEYSEIQKRITKELNGDIESTSPITGGSKVSLADTSTWYVDFNALAYANYLDETEAVDDSDATDNDDHEKDETKLPFLLESSAFYSRHDGFGLEELWQRNIPRANESVDIAIASSSSQSDAPESTTASRRDDESDSNENDERNNIPDKMDFDLATRSFVSELGNGSNSSIASDIDRAVDSNDYGVLRRYSRKSIVSTIPTDEKSDEDAQEEDGTRSSFTRHVVPSVSIENAETGLIRWRESPVKEKRVQETREMRIF